MNRINNIVLLIVTVTAFTLAQSNHIITIDGTINTSSGEMWNATNEAFGGATYITWDADYIYIGWTQVDFDGNDQTVYVSIDADPQLSPNQKTGNGSSDLGSEQYFRGSTVNAPFNADYIFMAKEVSSSLETHAYVYSSGWQMDGANSTTDHRNDMTVAYGNISGINKDVEMRISRAGIGRAASGDKIYIISYCKNLEGGAPAAGWGYLFRSVPSADGGGGGTGTMTFSNYYGLILQSGVNPNAGTNYNQSLPVELVSFSAAVRGTEAVLAWQTATEVNNFGFEVEKQSSINNWSKIGFVDGNGTINASRSYSFTDKSALGKISYRLKQIDRDGKFEYSQEVEVIALCTPKEFALEQNYPNPFNPTTTIGYQLPANGRTTLKIYDAIGREVATLVSEVKEAGYYSAQFDGAKLSSGIYFARLSSNEKSQIKKLLLMK